MRVFFASFVCSTVVALGAAWSWAAFAPMKYFDAEYPMWAAKQNLLRQCVVGQTTIAGDSRPMAGLLPGRMGGDAVNLALGGASPIEVAYLIEDLLRCPMPPQRVVVSFAAEHFLETDTYWTRSLAFGFLSVRQAEEIRAISMTLDDDAVYATSRWGSFADALKNYAYALKVPSFYFGAMLGGRFVMRGASNQNIFEQVTRDRGHHFFGTADGSSYVNASDANIRAFAPGPIFDHYFERAIAKLDARGIPLYYVGMPVNETTFRAMRPGLREQIGAYLQRHADRYANFRALGDPMPFLADEYFGDAEHLNQRGAAKWSDYVAAQLKEAAEAEARVARPARAGAL